MKHDRFLLATAILASLTAPVRAERGTPYDGYVPDKANEEKLAALPGGSAVVSGKLAVKNPEYGTVRPVNVRNMPFAAALRVQTTKVPVSEWNFQVKAPSQTVIHPGDRLLLTFYARAVSPETAVIEPMFEYAAPPWTKCQRTQLLLGYAWQRYYLPFEIRIARGEYLRPRDAKVRDFDPGQMQLVFNLGYQRQIIDLADVRLVNFGAAYPLDQLPATQRSERYLGEEPDAPWRARAAARIETLRKGNLDIHVVDEFGTPIPGARIHVAMKKHAFAFGGAINEIGLIYYNQYPLHAKFEREIQALCNTVTLENRLKWENWVRPTHRLIALKALDWCDSRGIAVRGHCLIWPDWDRTIWRDASPAEQKKLAADPDRLQREMLAHIRNEVSALRGRVVEWDVLNEPAFKRGIFDLLGPEAMVQWFRTARECDPKARLFINECDILSRPIDETPAERNLVKLVKQLKSHGNLIDGVGLQSHIGIPMAGPEALEKKLDRIARLGVAIRITEYTHSGVSEECAARYMKDFMTTVFSHPAVDGFIVWWFWDAQQGPGPLFRKDFTIKPAGEVYKDLVFHQWWTTADGQTDAKGQYQVRGFLGDYDVTVTHAGRSETHHLSLPRTGCRLAVSMLRGEGR